MTKARKELVHLDTTPYYHCVCRCVRRAYLWGEDAVTGRNYEHRRGWVLERLHQLQDAFAVEICAYAIMSNHYHLVVRLVPDQAGAWTESEVMARWERLFSLPPLVARYQAGQTSTEAERDKTREIIGQWRERLADLSWYMRCLNEHLARRANEEDGCKGRFWEGRFKCQALLDEAAVLTCMSYVDLNPVRAGMAETPETSDFTSVEQRISELKADTHSEPETNRPRLTPLTNPAAGNHPNDLSFSLDDYLALVDWAGRAIRNDKRGAIPADVPPILARLRLDAQHYVRYVQRGGRTYHVVALGHIERLRAAARQLGRRFLKGLNQSQQLYVQAM